MYDVPIFDCLTHPSLDGNWINTRWNGRNTFDAICHQMIENNVPWAFAVAMGTTDGYDVHSYAEKTQNCTPRLFPVAFVDFSDLGDTASLRTGMARLRALGYVGIKIHPRLSGIDLTHPALCPVIRAANETGLVTFLCTYHFSRNPSCVNSGTYHLYKLLHSIRDEKLVLLHGGGVHFLEIIEMTRHFKNILVDVSFTMCEFEGSSIDFDLKFAFGRYDHRLCIGSDSPEINMRRMRERFEYLCVNIGEKNKENIAYKNLLRYTGVGDGD